MTLIHDPTPTPLRVTAVVVAMMPADEEWLYDAVRSVYTQTVPCACVVVTYEGNPWIDALLSEFSKCRIRKAPQNYLGASRNMGSELVETEFVAYLDADDVWLPKKVATQIAAMDAHGLDLVGADHLLITEDGRPFAHSLSKYIPMPSSWMMRTSVWSKHRFDDYIKRSDDGDWWRKHFKSLKIGRIPNSLILYRVREQSLSSYSKSKWRKLVVAKSTKLFGRHVTLLATLIMTFPFRKNEYTWRKEWDQNTVI